MSAFLIRQMLTNQNDRDPWRPRSRFRGMRLMGTMRYHVIINERGSAYFCRCGSRFRGQSFGYYNLGRDRLKYKKWAGR